MAGQELIQIGHVQGKMETALNLLKMELLTDEQIAKATNLRPDEVKKLKRKLEIRRVCGALLIRLEHGREPGHFFGTGLTAD
ncbi:MAG: hypothetical protein R2941_01690 [Desulfobacterales bacterium]